MSFVFPEIELKKVAFAEGQTNNETTSCCSKRYENGRLWPPPLEMEQVFQKSGTRTILQVRKELAGMTVEDLHLLCEFNAWANRRTMEACASLTHGQLTRDLASSFRSVRDTLAHIC